jgi:hypothetical protein
VISGCPFSSQAVAAVMYRCSSNGRYHVSYDFCSPSAQFRRAIILIVISAASDALIASTSAA